MKLSIFIASALVMSLTIGMLPSNAESQPTLKATEAPEWTSLFDRRGEKNSWLGADGIFSVALDGNDSFGSAKSDTNTFFIFSDTLMGSANALGKVTRNAGMPAQSGALLKGDQPSKDAISFIYGNRGNGTLGQHMFGEHKWMLDCYVQGGNLYILGFPHKDWKPKQIDLITIPIKSDGTLNMKKFKKTAAISELCYWEGDTYLYAYGVGITANTESAGAPNPDGYIYIYGYRDAMKEFSRKDLIVSRIKEEDFPDFSKLTYWQGDSWGSDIQKSAPVLSAVSCELSVTPVTSGPYSGKYIAVYTENTQSSNIMYSIADTPWGPFSNGVKCYHAEEHGQKGGIGTSTRYVYNAKAHPHLSKGDLLLVSYNVNVGSGAEQYTTDYHPRFIWLDLDPEHDYVPPVNEEQEGEKEEQLQQSQMPQYGPENEKEKSGNIGLYVGITAGVTVLGSGAVFVTLKKRKDKLKRE